MDLYDFYKTVTDGVAKNDALNIWVTSIFGSNLSVYAGMPADAVDMEDDPPFLIFGEPTRSCSQRERIITYACAVWMGLSVTGAKTFNPDNESELQGVEYIMDGMRLVRLAVVGVLPAGIILDEFVEYADVNAVGTEVHGDMNFVFRETLTIGMDPMQ